MDNDEFLLQFERLQTEKAMAEVALIVLEKRRELGMLTPKIESKPKQTERIAKTVREKCQQLVHDFEKVMYGESELTLLEFFDLGEVDATHVLEFFGIFQPIGSGKYWLKNKRAALHKMLNTGVFKPGPSNSECQGGKRTFDTQDLVEKRMGIDGKSDIEQIRQLVDSGLLPKPALPNDDWQSSKNSSREIRLQRSVPN